MRKYPLILIALLTSYSQYRREQGLGLTLPFHQSYNGPFPDFGLYYEVIHNSFCARQSES